MPTISGRASAADDITIPAPMVAASATAILIDINLLHLPAPFGALKCLASQARLAGLTHASLTACINRVVSTPAARLISIGGTKEMFESK